MIWFILVFCCFSAAVYGVGYRTMVKTCEDNAATFFFLMTVGSLRSAGFALIIGMGWLK